MTKSLTPKQEDFLEALLGEARGHIRAAMDLAGYSRTTKTAEVVGPLREEITERAGMILAMNAPKAAFGIVGVLDDPSATGARNAISAAREVLDRMGLVKKNKWKLPPILAVCLFYLQKLRLKTFSSWPLALTFLYRDITFGNYPWSGEDQSRGAGNGPS